MYTLIQASTKWGGDGTGSTIRRSIPGRCETNANRSKYARGCQNSGYAELPPFLESGGAIELEEVPAGETAFLVEVI